MHFFHQNFDYKNLTNILYLSRLWSLGSSECSNKIFSIRDILREHNDLFGPKLCIIKIICRHIRYFVWFSLRLLLGLDFAVIIMCCSFQLTSFKAFVCIVFFQHIFYCSYFGCLNANLNELFINFFSIHSWKNSSSACGEKMERDNMELNNNVNFQGNGSRTGKNMNWWSN